MSPASVCDATDAYTVLLRLLVKWVIVLDIGFEEVEVSLQGMAADPTDLC